MGREARRVPTDFTTLGGYEVVVSDILPTIPSDGENARRLVRHLFHEAGYFAATLGPVGPRPDEPTHCYLLERQGVIIASQEFADQLRAARADDRRGRHSPEGGPS